MKWVIAVILSIAAVVTWVWHHQAVKAQAEALDRSQKRLGLVSDHIDSGNLEAANSLLIQVQIDLNVSGGLFTPTPIEEKKRALGGQRTDLKAKLEERVAATRQVLGRVVRCVENEGYL
jgi:hypothetical protein